MHISFDFQLSLALACGLGNEANRGSASRARIVLSSDAHDRTFGYTKRIVLILWLRLPQLPMFVIRLTFDFIWSFKDIHWACNANVHVVTRLDCLEKFLALG